MRKRRSLVLEGIVLAAVIIVAVGLFWLGGEAAPGTGAGAASASPTNGPVATPSATASMFGAGSTPPGVAASLSPEARPSSATAAPPTPAATATATATPASTPRPTPPRRATGDPRLAFADFLSHVNEGRANVDDLNRALSAAVNSGDREATRTAALAILDFVDGERLWLGDHPPADCYAAAHAAGVAMLDAYQTAASLFVDWTNASGLDALLTLGRAADAATVAASAFTAFGDELVATRCPA